MLFTYIQLYFIGLCIFVVLDFVWLFFVTPNFIRPGQEGVTQEEASHWYYAFYFYPFFVLVLLLFAVFFLLPGGPLWMVMFRGLLFGLFVYSFYNLVNKKDKKFTSLGNTLDLFWGGFLSSATAGSVYFIYFNYLN